MGVEVESDSTIFQESNNERMDLWTWRPSCYVGRVGTQHNPVPSCPSTYSLPRHYHTGCTEDSHWMQMGWEWLWAVEGAGERNPEEVGEGVLVVGCTAILG